jgi:hypothetical protein
MDDSLQMDTRGGAKRRKADEEGPAVPTLNLAIAQIAHIEHRFNAEKRIKGKPKHTFAFFGKIFFKNHLQGVFSCDYSNFFAKKRKSKVFWLIL